MNEAEESLVRRRGAIRKAVIAWYGRCARDLSWRGTGDPYAVWVAEVILQQTRVDQGTPYIERFLREFPDVHSLARATGDRVLKVWEGLGYYARARNLHKAARHVAGELGGVFPETAEAWMRLPGVGRYTAGAIASIGFGEETPLVDGNVKRVIARLANISDCVDDAAVSERVWVLAGALVRGPSPGALNQGLMELGATVCKPRDPDCPGCPVKRHCAAFALGTQARLPVLRERKKPPHHEIVVGAIAKKGRFLLGKRPPGGLLGGLWEFPGGKVARGETHAAALIRELREELGIEVEVGGLVASVKHAYSHFKVTLNVYRCEHISGRPKPRAHTELRWAAASEFSDFAFPKANHKFLQLLAEAAGPKPVARSRRKKNGVPNGI